MRHFQLAGCLHPRWSVSFQVWSTLRTVSASQQTILGLSCVSLMDAAEQNITARSRCLNWHLPCFNSRCQRVSVRAVLYCLWSGAIRDTRKSAHCLWLVGHTPGESKRGRDTESDAVIRLEEIHTFFSNECFICSSTRNLHHALPVILLITPKRTLLIAAIPLHPQSSSFYFT